MGVVLLYHLLVWRRIMAAFRPGSMGGSGLKESSETEVRDKGERQKERSKRK
jgi:hypothetical protein